MFRMFQKRTANANLKIQPLESLGGIGQHHGVERFARAADVSAIVLPLD